MSEPTPPSARKPLIDTATADAYRLFMEESNQGIVIIGEASEPLFANRAYAALFGYDDVDDILALGTVEHLIAPQDKARTKQFRTARLKGGSAPARYDFVGIRRDGTEITLETIVTSMRWKDRNAIQATVTDVTEARSHARETQEGQARAAAQHKALLDVARHDANDASHELFFNLVTESSARTIQCARASIWLYETPGGAASLRDRFDCDADMHTSGAHLSPEHVPRFFKALGTERAISVRDARVHPMTADFAESYLEPNNIASVIGAPLRSGGDVVGFLACEHAGEAREWHADEETFIASMADIVAQQIERARRRFSDDRLLESQARYRNLFQSAPIALWEEDWSDVRELLACIGYGSHAEAISKLETEPVLYDAATACIKFGNVNNATMKLLGATSRADCKAHLSTETVTMPDVGLIDRIKLFLSGGHRLTVTSMMRRLDGEVIDVRLHLEMPAEHSDEWSRIYVAMEDVTEHEALSRALAWQASHDPLTGLVNRREFEHRLGRALANAQEAGSHHALAYLDLDQFKVVNDSCGHLAGDQLLSALASRLRRAVRRHDTVARLGGDEFAVLMEDCPFDQAHVVAEQLRRVIEEFRFAWEGHSFSLGVSTGLVDVNANSGDMHQLLADADAACYAAKDAGRNRVHVYTPGDENIAQRRGEAEWISRIQAALDDDLFELEAQPIMPLNAHTDSRRRLEVLVRMRTENGLAWPGTFLPAAERYGLTVKLDRWVVAQTLRAMAAVPTDDIVVSINLSGHSLGDESFRTFLCDLVETSDVAPESLCFEVTESAAIANYDKATRLMNALREMGCAFALDDFGRGLSSFEYLKTLPVDVLKIDGLFVRGIADDDVDLSMVRTINEMGHVVGMRTVAEFVEDDDILAILKDLGVDYAQGYAVGESCDLASALASSN